MIELKPNGANIPVTEENKKEYVSLITQHRMTTAIKQQIEVSHSSTTGNTEILSVLPVQFANAHAC